jgi:pilus assembly protein TadC
MNALPTYVAGDLKFKRHKICGSKTGNNCCMAKFRKSDFTQYGPGVVIYFQFIKYWATIMFLLTLFSLPAFIFYYSGNIISRMKNPDMTDVFTAFTLGNIG